MSDRVENCKEFVRRIVMSLSEWRAARSCHENCKESDRVESCRSLLGEL